MLSLGTFTSAPATFCFGFGTAGGVTLATFCAGFVTLGVFPLSFGGCYIPGTAKTTCQQSKHTSTFYLNLNPHKYFLRDSS